MGDLLESAETDQLNCRFYENQYPAIEETVIVNVTEIAEMGAYVTLLEYNNIEGMILLSELSRRRIRSINKLIRVNRTEVVSVLRVDTEKGYIDLSKRRVDPEDVAKCEDRYNKAKAVHSVMRHVATHQRIPLEDVYRRVGWPLYRKYGHAYDAFKLALGEAEEDIFACIPETDETTRNQIMTYIRRRLAPQPVRVRADIEVTCFTYRGIDAIREALLAGEAASVKEAPLKIKLIAPPMYVLTTTTIDKEVGLAACNDAINRIGDVIRSQGGTLEVKMAPKAITLREENELQQRFEDLEREQEEQDGDAPEDI